MMDCTKYEKQYFMPPTPTFDWVKKEKIEKAPISELFLGFCSRFEQAVIAVVF